MDLKTDPRAVLAAIAVRRVIDENLIRCLHPGEIELCE